MFSRVEHTTSWLAIRWKFAGPFFDCDLITKTGAIFFINVYVKTTQGYLFLKKKKFFGYVIFIKLRFA